MSEFANQEYLKDLNDQQRAAVRYMGGPELVIAGAGSGKTRVLTYKIMHLLNMGYEPYRILALTFTNKAAREMKQRIADVAGESSARRIWMGTFHSVFLRILRSHADKLGFRSDFTIYDTADSKSLIHTIIKDLNLDDKVYKAAQIQSTISNAKNALYNASSYANNKEITRRDAAAGRPMTAEIFRQYALRCKTAQAMDFDDILYYMNLLLRDHADIKRHYQEFFRYILVDEYQDTNFAQHLIIQQLAGEHPMFCAVGDDAQSIYSFRGANINNILGLERRFPGLKVFKLERNYRSTKNIISAAGSLIEKNVNQIQKNVYSENEEGSPVNILESYSDLEEAALVAKSIINTRLVNHDSYADYAILYRTNAQSRALEEALRKRNVPYRIYGGLSFYQRKEIKDAVCYFRLTVNPSDDEALQRIINYPARGIGQTTVKKVRDAAVENGVAMFEVLKNPEKYKLAIHSGTLKKLNGFYTMMEQFITMYKESRPAFEVVNAIYNKTGILTEGAMDNTPEAVSRRENLTSLLAAVQEFTDERLESGDAALTLSDFLSEVSLATDQDTDSSSDDAKVTLMTVHSAKGLEFRNVYIVGVEEDLFPSLMAQDSREDIEEERRLLYVAITRAKVMCTITFAKSRFRNGQTQSTRPSRFISDINPAYLRLQISSTIPGATSESFVNPLRHNYSGRNYGQSIMHHRPSSTVAATSQRQNVGKSVAPETVDSDMIIHNASDVREGMIIVHHRFGRGTISAVEQSAEGAFIYVEFDNTGHKKLMLRFAKFKIIG